MTRIITLLLFSFILSSKANSQVVLKDYDDASKRFYNFFENPSNLDKYGNVVIDMGSASAGRVKFNLNDVKLSMVERPEEPGCADICPPSIYINFECVKSKCLSDPIMNNLLSESGSIQIMNLARGREAFDYLKALKNFMSKN